MSFDVQIPTRDVIKATQSGELNLETTKWMLAQIANVAKDKAGCGILIDTRKATPNLSTTDLWLLANHLASYGRTFHRKTAVLATQESSDLVGFFKLCANNRGFPVSTFTDYDEAMSWLLWPVEAKAA